MNWNPSPEIISFGPLALRWYGMLFAGGFALAYLVLRGVFKREKVPIFQLDELLMYTLVGCVVGARLGHCLFYEPERYLSDPLEILFVWKGGLASHGAAIGMLFSSFLFSRSKPGRPSFLWIVDRIALTVPLSATCVRLGNFFNSEIVGKPTESDWGIVFSRIDSQPRHPAQLYEALVYFIFFWILFFVQRRYGAKTPRGLLFGLCFVFIFTARFLIEFVKENQVDFESELTLNMGQLLSIPAVLLGIGMIIYSRRPTHPRPRRVS